MPSRPLASTGVPDEIERQGRLFFRLKVAQNVAKAALDAAFDDVGLTTTQFLALVAIEHHATASSAELARRSFVTPQAMIVNVARLEALGLIERSPAPGGGRSLETRLTAAGAATLLEAKARAAAIDRYVRERIGDACVTELVGGLEKLATCLSESVTVTTARSWDAYCTPEA